MRLHKLVVAMSALAGGIASVDSHALGLGDVKLHTALNQPLVAEIELMQVEDLTRTEILSNLASKSDFARAGVERPQVLSDLLFKTEVSPNGKGVIKITSKDPIQEPFLNFLVEVHWPNGRLLKEYTLLLDPPVFSGRTSASVTRPEILPISDPAAVVRPITRFEYLPPASSARPERNRRPDSFSSTPDQGSQLRSVSPASYRVNNNDNLWNIAQQVRPDRDVTVQQTMLAIQRKNPKSFIDSNINRLKRGEILRIPDRREITSLTVNEAIAGVSRQNREWQQWRSQIAQLDGTRSKAPALPEPKATVEGKLAIVSAEGATGSGQDLGGGADQNNAALQTELAMTREQLDKLSRENAELKSRLQDLDDQIVTLRRLVEMKDDQMAVLQSRLQQSREQNESSEPQISNISIGVPDNPLYLMLGLIPFVGVGWLLVQRRLKKRREEKAKVEKAASAKKNRPQPTAFNRGPDSSPKPVASPSAEVAAKFDQALARATDEAEADVEDTAQQTEDPLGEADIYIAYGRLAQAEELLKQAIFNEPARNDLKLKLLKVYSESGEFDKFNQVLTEVEASGDADAIAQAAVLQASFDNDLAVPIEDDIPDLDLDELELADSDFRSSVSPETASNADQLDVDLDKLGLEFGSEDPLARDSQAAFSDQGVSSLEASLDEDFDFLSEGDEVATKLDLARAYIDMGDRDGASAILQEVLEQGTDVQKQEARMLLAGGSI